MTKSAESATIQKPVEFFSEDWNKTLDRHRLVIFPTYYGQHLLEVRINLNTGRYRTEEYQWHELLAKGEKALPTYASIEHDRTDFERGMINIRVNSAVTGYKEEAIAEWLVWLTADFLPSIAKC